MSTAAPLQNTAAKPQSTGKSLAAGLLLQRKCACGDLASSSLTGECETCKGKRLQTKLTIGASNDPLEQEADRIADQVLAAPAHSLVNGAAPRIQRLTGQATGDAGTAHASVDRVLASSGRPLDPALQKDMGQRFCYDFSRVRMHTDTSADQSARDVNARAYTVGHNIVFGAGRFDPTSHEGRRLLAHELTHVVQLNCGAVAAQPRSGSAVIHRTPDNGSVTKKVPKKTRAQQIDERLQQYDDIIKRIAKETGIDAAVIRAIIAAESGGDPAKTSPTGYKGLMQAGKTGDVKAMTGSYDPETSIREGAKIYSGKARAVFGSLRKHAVDTGKLTEEAKMRLVMIAYNAGEGTVAKALQFADEAGDAARWYEPEHFQRALLFTGAYEVFIPDPPGRNSIQLAAEVQLMEGLSVEQMQVQYLTKSGTWNIPKLQKSFRRHLKEQYKANRHKGVKLEEAPKWLRVCVARKHDRQRRPGGYLDQFAAKFRHFSGVGKPITRPVAAPSGRQRIKPGAPQTAMAQGLAEIERKLDTTLIGTDEWRALLERKVRLLTEQARDWLVGPHF